MTDVFKLEQKLDERSGEKDGRYWKAASYLATTYDQRPENVVFDVTDGDQHRVAQFDSLVGRKVEIVWGISARMYNGKWFNKVQAWTIREVS